MSDEYLDAMHENRDRLANIGRDLFALSMAFRTTGNKEMSKTLNILGEELFDAEKSIGDAVSRELNKQFQHSQEETGNVLKMVLESAISKDSDSLDQINQEMEKRNEVSS